MQRLSKVAGGLSIAVGVAAHALACSPPAAPSSPPPQRAGAPVPARARPERTFHWNEQVIAWRPFAQAMQTAREEQKPVLVLLYAYWCGDSSSFVNTVLADANVVETMAKFVVTRVDTSREQELAEHIAPDVRYVPSVLFLNSAGSRLDVKSLDGSEGEYTYDYQRPGPFLEGMQKALALTP